MVSPDGAKGGSSVNMKRTGLSGMVWVAVAVWSSGCEETSGLARAQAILAADPLAVDFGTVSLGQEGRQTVLLSNVGPAAALELRAEFEDDCGGCFVLRSRLPAGLASRQEVEVELGFRAVREASATGTVRFVAGTDRDAPSVEIEVMGAGRDDSAPDVAVRPDRLDFGGFVPAGGRAVDTLVIESTGTNDLLVDSIRIEPPSMIYRITTSTPTPDNPGRLPPGADAAVSVRVDLPEGVNAADPARIIIDTNVLEEKNVPGVAGRVEVPLQAIGNRAPQAVIEVAEDVAPFTRIDVDGSASFDPDDPPDEPLTYRWRLVSAPAGSQARLQSQSLPQSAFFADLSGEYVIELTVTDAVGLASTETVVIDARPEEGIRVELIWDHPDSDVDLHLMREGASFCTCQGIGDPPGAPSDVHYRCRSQNWYPDAPGANPLLDVDDARGFGPEVITLEGDGPDDFIPADRYTIVVHYFSDKRNVSSFPTNTANATVRVFIFGLQVAEYDQPLLGTGDLWEVAQIEWPSGDVQERGQILDGFECGFFSKSSE
jgi:hypothetical protein